MSPYDTPTAPQLRLLKGLAGGDVLRRAGAVWKVMFVGRRETFSMETLFSCIHRAWIAEGWIGRHNWTRRRITSISDLGRETIKRGEARDG